MNLLLSTVCNLGAFVYPVGPGDRTGAPLREEMNKVDKDYVSVTEIAGDEVTQEKDRLRSFGCWVLGENKIHENSFGRQDKD